MNTGGLANVLLGGLLGLLLAGGAAGLLVYGFVARDPRRSFKAAVAAFGVAIVSALLSSTFWIVVLSGHDTHGEPFRYAEASPAVALVVIEALVLAASAPSVVISGRRIYASAHTHVATPNQDPERTTRGLE